MGRRIGSPAMTPRPPAPSRREVLALGGAGVAALVLVACGDDGATTATTVSKDRSLAQFFGGGPQLAAGVQARAPFGVADADGLLPIDDTPEQLDVTIV